MLQVRDAVGNEAAVLGFAGAPFTLASYIVEGGSSKNYSNLKKMAFSEPDVLHALLGKLADNVTDYMRYQADHGAQVRSLHAWYPCTHSHIGVVASSIGYEWDVRVSCLHRLYRTVKSSFDTVSASHDHA